MNVERLEIQVNRLWYTFCPYGLTYKYTHTRPRKRIDVFIVLGNSFVIVFVFIFHYVGRSGMVINSLCVYIGEKKCIKRKTAGTGVIGMILKSIYFCVIIDFIGGYREKASQTRKMPKTSLSSRSFAPSNCRRNSGFVKTGVHFKT